MSQSHRVGDIEIDQDIGFQQKEWVVQRIAWGIMLLIVVLALIGLFGTGPISSASDETGDGALAVDYQRFVRHDGRVTLSFKIDPGQAQGNQVELWVSQDYLNDVEVQAISPQPTEARGAGDRTVYVFSVADPAGPLQVQFSLRPQSMGRLAGAAGVGENATVTFDQISYP
jgi:hypothetical protein